MNIIFINICSRFEKKNHLQKKKRKSKTGNLQSLSSITQKLTSFSSVFIQTELHFRQNFLHMYTQEYLHRDTQNRHHTFTISGWIIFTHFYHFIFITLFGPLAQTCTQNCWFGCFGAWTQRTPLYCPHLGTCWRCGGRASGCRCHAGSS